MTRFFLNRTLPVMLALATCLPLAPTVLAQMFSDSPLPRNAGRTVSATYGLIDFAYDGDVTEASRFDFDQPAYGVTVASGNLLFSLMIGSQQNETGGDSRQLIDAGLITWSGIPLNRSQKTRIEIPVVIYSNYRSVAGRELVNTPENDFRVTTLGIGSGLVLNSVGDKTEFQARAMPIIGLTLQQIGEGSGSARVLDTDASLSFPRLIGRLGLSFGYGFRWQKWDVQSSNLFTQISDETLDYRGTQHVFRVGVNW